MGWISGVSSRGAATQGATCVVTKTAAATSAAPSVIACGKGKSERLLSVIASELSACMRDESPDAVNSEQTSKASGRRRPGFLDRRTLWRFDATRQLETDE